MNTYDDGVFQDLLLDVELYHIILFETCSMQYKQNEMKHNSGITLYIQYIGGQVEKHNL